MSRSLTLAAIATAYATNGARVIIAGRRKDVLDKAVGEISKAAAKGGSAVA